MRIACTALIASLIAATVPAQETNYQPLAPGAPRNETTFQPVRAPQNETGFNAAARPATIPGAYMPEGISAASGIALISAERASGGFAAIAEPIQGAARSALTLPFNVAPLDAGSLEAQANHFTAAAVNRFVVHVPRAGDAARFSAMARTVGRGIVVLAESAEGLPAETRAIVLPHEDLAREVAAALLGRIPEDPPLVGVFAAEDDPAAQRLTEGIRARLQEARGGNARLFPLPPDMPVDGVLKRLQGGGVLHGIVIADPRLAQSVTMAVARHGADLAVVAIGDTEELRRAEARRAVHARFWYPWEEIIREAIAMFARPVPDAPRTFELMRSEAPAAPSTPSMGTPG